jgi:hypothetical protein
MEIFYKDQIAIPLATDAQNVLKHHTAKNLLNGWNILLKEIT